MWDQAEHLAPWQGAPRGFTLTTHKTEIRPGGISEVCMRSPEGVEHWLRIVYRDIVEPELLIFTHVWLDGDGNPGKETLVTITFTERGGQTELTLRQTGFESVESRDGHGYGWTSALDVLGEYLTAVRAAAG